MNKKQFDIKGSRTLIITITFIVVAIFLCSILFGSLFSSASFLNGKDATFSENSKVIILSDRNSGNTPLTVHFESLVQQVDEDVDYYWDFGDGSISHEREPTHIYEIKGDYVCTLTISAEDTKISDETRINVIDNNPPIIKILVDTTSGNRPLTVNFDVDGFDTDGDIVSYEWEIQYPPLFSYQKVSTSDKKNFTEKFLRPGFYEVKLTVTDDSGNIATDYIKIQVLGHKIELLIGTSLYYAGQVTTLINIFNKIMDKLDGDQPDTVFGKILSFFEGRNNK